MASTSPKRWGFSLSSSQVLSYDWVRIIPVHPLNTNTALNENEVIKRKKIKIGHTDSRTGLGNHSDFLLN